MQLGNNPSVGKASSSQLVLAYEDILKYLKYDLTQLPYFGAGEKREILDGVCDVLTF